MGKESCFHCDVKELIRADQTRHYNVQQIGEGLILILAEHIVLNTHYQSETECKAFAMVEFMRAMQVAFELKNSGEIVVNVEQRGFVQ